MYGSLKSIKARSDAISHVCEEEIIKHQSPELMHVYGQNVSSIIALKSLADGQVPSHAKKLPPRT
jgi:hypothetical protein